MIEMTDAEFVEAIKARLCENGWQTGAIGTAEGPNCLLGAAGFVAHNGDLIVDEFGMTPVKLDGQALGDDCGYERIPGMTRLAKLMGTPTVFQVSCINDKCASRDEAIAEMERRVNV